MKCPCSLSDMLLKPILCVIAGLVCMCFNWMLVGGGVEGGPIRIDEGALKWGTLHRSTAKAMRLLNRTAFIPALAHTWQLDKLLLMGVSTLRQRDLVWNWVSVRSRLLFRLWWPHSPGHLICRIPLVLNLQVIYIPAWSLTDFSLPTTSVFSLRGWLGMGSLVRSLAALALISEHFSGADHDPWSSLFTSRKTCVHECRQA